jgi:hypothetical protein
VAEGVRETELIDPERCCIIHFRLYEADMKSKWCCNSRVAFSVEMGMNTTKEGS